MVEYSALLLQSRGLPFSSRVFLNLICFLSYLHQHHYRQEVISHPHSIMRSVSQKQNNSCLCSINNTEALSHCAAVRFKSWGNYTQRSEGREEATLYNSKQTEKVYTEVKLSFYHPYIFLVRLLKDAYISTTAVRTNLQVNSNSDFFFPPEYRLIIWS